MPKVAKYTAPKDAKPWDRQTDEPPTAYMAFCCYRDFGPSRTVKLALEDARKKKVTRAKSISGWQKWSAAWDWKGRVTAWDDHMQAVVRDAQVDEIAEMNKRHAGVAVLAISKAFNRLRAIPTEKLTVEQAIKLLRLGVDIERLARGEEQLASAVGGEGMTLVQLVTDAQGELKRRVESGELNADEIPSGGHEVPLAH